MERFYRQIAVNSRHRNGKEPHQYPLAVPDPARLSIAPL
jgi:hypothetical protein